MRISKLLAVITLCLLLAMTLVPAQEISASVNAAPTVTSDPAAQIVEPEQSIAPVEVAATDVTPDMPPFDVWTTWKIEGGAAQAGLPDGLTFVPGSCTPIDSNTTCTGILSGEMSEPLGTYIITVYVEDQSLEAGFTDIKIIVDNYPSADAGGPYTVAEGHEIVLAGTGSDPDGDPLEYAWDLDNDGYFETPGQSVSYVGLNGPASRSVGLAVCDDKGACTTSYTTVTVYNVSPSVTNDIPEQRVSQDDRIKTVTISAWDVVGDLPGSIWTEWTRNGGTSYTGLPAGLLLTFEKCTPMGLFSTCTWTLGGWARFERGTYLITVYVTDKDGATGSTVIKIVVGNEPPVADPGGDPGGEPGVYTVNEGESITLSGSGTDPEGDPLTFAWDFDGDGTFETPGQNPTFSAATLDGPDTQTVVLQVCDDRGGCDTAEAVINIVNVAPVVTNNLPTQELLVNQAIAPVTVSATDVTVDTPLAIATAWTKDGGASQTGLPAGLTLTPGACTPSGAKSTCTWILAGSQLAVGEYVVTVTASDDDGGSDSTEIEIIVKQVRIFLPLIFKA